MSKKQRNIAVIGLGTFGATLARELARFGDHVLGIDCDDSIVSAIAEDIDRAVIGDATEAKALEEAGIADYDVCVVATTRDLESNLLAVMHARQVGVKTIWAKSMSTTHTSILEHIGVERILQPEASYGELVAQQLHNPLVIGSVKLADGLHFAMIEAPQKVCGKCLEDLELTNSEGIRCVGIQRKDSFVEPTDGEEVREGDHLLLIGSRDAMRGFADNG